MLYVTLLKLDILMNRRTYLRQAQEAGFIVGDHTPNRELFALFLHTKWN